MKRRNKTMKPRREVSPIGGLAVFSQRRLKEQLGVSLRNTLPEENQRSIASDYYLAVAAFTNGYADFYHFNVIAAALNTSSMLVKQGLGTEYQPLMTAALQALARASERFDKFGKYGFDGEGLIAIKDAGELHEEHLRVATRMDLARVIIKTDKRLKEGDIMEQLHSLPEAA